VRNPTVATPQRRQRRSYEHLRSLIEERACLPAGHPRRPVIRRQLITGYLPVAQHIARRYAYRGENLEDLEQVAAVGLIHAVDRFELDRGVDFLSFAVPTITGEVQRHFRDRTRTIRLPRRLTELQREMYEAAERLGQQLGRAPRPSEIAARLDMPLSRVVDGLQVQNASRCASLDESFEDSSSEEYSRFDAHLGSLDPELDLMEYRETLGPLLRALPERKRTIVLLRFFGGLTQFEIGSRLGISQMHVSRLLSASLAELHGALTIEE
jgi:RNA polymerase sigma-B factor